jgi:imidazolonepropionase
MPSLLLDDIGELVTGTPDDDDLLGIRHDAALVVDEGRVAWIGSAGSPPAADRRIDCRNGCVIPGFVDSHSHLVFAGDRSQEFAARMAGAAYSAGGIRITVAATRAASDADLRSTVARLTTELIGSGSTTFEIKSGYGLTVPDEVRGLRIAGEFSPETTFLGAHVVPAEFATDRAGYVELLTGPMLDACAGLSRWIDVFCDRGAFDGEESRAVLQAGIARGLVPRVHANQLRAGPGVRVAVEMAAASADHCTHLTDADVDLLAQTAASPQPTVATLLPGAEFSTRSPYPDARRLLTAGAIVALATDCNPGTSYTTSMPLCIALAVREMHMTVAEALWAATVGGATALRRQDVGRIRVGGPADLVLLEAPTYLHLAYRPGVQLIRRVLRAGVEVA